MDDLIAEQVAYYRARAGEYDRELREKGRYASLGGGVAGPPQGEQDRQLLTIEAELIKRAPFGRALELAAGTGWWTQLLAANASTVTAVDASEEMLAFNRQRVGKRNVRYIVADIFNWTPPSTYDLVFFAAWLSHVPRGRFDAFWETVRLSLAPGGQVYFVDELAGPETEVEDWIDEETVSRSLEGGGRKFRAVKIFYEPEALQSKLQAMGWHATVTAAGAHLYYGVASR